MSNPIMRSSFQSDMLPIINDWHGDDLKLFEDIVPEIMEVLQSDAAQEIDGVLMGMSTLVKKGESQMLSYDTSRQLYTPMYKHDTWALGFTISMELMQDGKAFREARRFTKMLSKARNETRNILAANVLNNGYTSGVTMTQGDGAILFTASHPSPVGNQSNTITVNAALSEASVESLYIQIRNMVDDRNIRVNAKPRKLIVNPNLEPSANRIIHSVLRSGTTNNDLNFIRESGMLPEGVLATPYLTSTTQYVILTDVMDGLKFYDRYESGIEEDNVFDTKNAAFSKVIRCSTGWTQWRAVFGAQGA